MAKIGILQVGAYPEPDVERLQQRFELHRLFEAADPQAFMQEHAGQIRAIATRGDLKADRALLDALPNVEIIVVNGVGYDGVDVGLARERGIAVTNTPDVLTRDVADLAVAMMLMQVRGMRQADHWVRSGQWGEKGPISLKTSVADKRAGILGLGRIGRATAERLAAFDMQISYSATAKKGDTGDWAYHADVLSLAKNCDYLFVTLAANASTRHIVSREVIEALGPEGMVVNVSRAANIDEEALLDALEQGTLGSAALDVFEGEPKINPRFMALDNVVLQPHQGSGTVGTRAAMGQLVFDNLVAHFDGKPLLTPVSS